MGVCIKKNVQKLSKAYLYTVNPRGVPGVIFKHQLLPHGVILKFRGLNPSSEVEKSKKKFKGYFLGLFEYW